MKKYNENNELINVYDIGLGREISTEHMIDLITWTENDTRFEYGTLTHLTSDQARKEVVNNLDKFMKKHFYEYIKGQGQ